VISSSGGKVRGEGMIFLSANVKSQDQAPFYLTLDDKKNSGYIIARMRYEIVFAPEAVQDYKRLSARERSVMRDVLERHLRNEPGRTSKSRIKRLRGMSKPQYRLRIDEIRVFYDVRENTVEILAIIPKARAAAWLEEKEELKNEKSITICS
jgi:mRNA-degrading endonuclease RelE of RelBE toxin-antitoxin system